MTTTIPLTHGPVDETGGLLHEGDLAAQLALAVTNLEAALAARSLGWSHVVSLRIRTTDPEGLAEVVDALDERLDPSGAAPSVSVVLEPALALPGMAVALDADVALGDLRAAFETGDPGRGSRDA